MNKDDNKNDKQRIRIGVLEEVTPQQPVKNSTPKIILLAVVLLIISQLFTTVKLIETRHGLRAARGEFGTGTAAVSADTVINERLAAIEERLKVAEDDARTADDMAEKLGDSVTILEGLAKAHGWGGARQ